MTEQHSLNRYSELWAKPLRTEAPCGEDCSFSPELEAIRAEVDKDGSLHATEGTNWQEVSQLAGEFLSKQSKDVWILAYAVYAEYRVNGLEACASAFVALTHILRMWWDNLYPSGVRQQRRLAPLAWLCTRMEHAAETTCFMDGSPESVRALREAFLELQKLLEEKTGEAAPPFSGVFAKIQDNSQPAPPPETISSISSSDQAPASRGVASIGASFAEMDKDGRIPPGILPQLIRNILEQTRQLAVHFLSLNVLDERAYLLHRAALWGTLLQLPQADANGQTQLTSGVPPDKMRAYTAAVAGKQYEEILPQLERSAGRATFWFDGHVMVVRCLEGLKAFQAASCVRKSLGVLLQRFPELLSYTFKDTTPFASPQSLSLLEGLSTATQSGEAPSEMDRSPLLTGAVESERLREAISLGMEEGFQTGLHKLGVVPAGRSRAAVVSALTQARYCIALGKKKAAARLLSAVYKQMDEWNLLDWEPELSAQMLSLLLSLPAKQTSGASEEMIHRLHWLSLDTAFTVLQEN